jgi:hypothetical protein
MANKNKPTDTQTRTPAYGFIFLLFIQKRSNEDSIRVWDMYSEFPGGDRWIFQGNISQYISH